MTSNRSEVVILLLGQTGVGKSTFINSVANNQVAEVGNSLLSCTKDIQDIPIPFTSDDKMHKIHLIDTPGFNNAWDEDVQIFDKIRKWLVDFHAKSPSVEFAGILYLYDISQARNTAEGNSSVSYKEFELPPLVQNLRFISTHWNIAKSVEAIARERELQKNYWQLMLQRGAEVSRFYGSTESATDIISRVLEKSPHNFTSVLMQFDAIRQKVPKPVRRRDKIGGFFARLFRTPGGISAESKN